VAILTPPEAPPSATPTQSPPTPAPTSVPTPGVEPAPPRQRGVAGGLILIAVGLVVLFSTWFPAGGAWLFLGLAAAFLVARVLTGHFGYAVPAGILLGFGSFVGFTETGILSPSLSGGMFFVFLGLGFLASYAIAARPQAVWPIVPGMLLIGFGVFVQATTFGVPFAEYWWLAQYWPLSLVAVGAWLLLRDRLPAETRAPVTIVGAGALILIGLLVAAAGMASVATPYLREPMPMPWPMFQVPFGNPTMQDTITLSAPTGSMTSIQLVNTSGSTVVRSTVASAVSVQATRHYWTSNQAPDVQLVPSGGVLVVQASPVVFGGSAGYIDYVVDVPTALGADIRSASGSIAINGLDGPVHIETASGGIRMSNLGGDVRVSSASGGIFGTEVDRVSDAHSMSGGIDLTGDFASSAQIASVSGSVMLRFAPTAAVHIDATSLSGNVSAAGLALTGQATGPHSLSGNLGNGGPTVSVHTTSGSIRLVRGS
jgi:putative adhesin/cell wall-active antibiotic response 4TMS protein YvqF